LAGGVTVAPRDPEGHVRAFVYHALLGNPEPGPTGETAVNVMHGAILDDTFARFLRVNGLGEHLIPLPEPDTAGHCPLDGEPDCRELVEADRQVKEAIQHSPRGGLLGFSIVEVDATGHPTGSRSQHLVHVAVKVSIDWRTSALVRVGAHTRRYREWFRPGEEPDPALPSVPPKLCEPEHLLRTPACVRRWYTEQVAACHIIDAERLPSPDVRKELREKAGLSRPKVAELVGVSPKRRCDCGRPASASRRARTGRSTRRCSLSGSAAEEPPGAPVEPEPPVLPRPDPRGGIQGPNPAAVDQ
jgi:hypothetical protein